MSPKISKKQPENIESYSVFLEQLKARIKKAQIKAVLSVNSELIELYWDLGKSIVEKQEKEGWKAQIIHKLGKDLQNAFPGIKGFSRANLFYMRTFYLAYARVQQAVGLLNTLPIARIPWGHNVLLITKIKDIQERLWYAEQTIENGLSRHALENWIISKAYKRQGKSITNFSKHLPAPQSMLAQELLKDPYNFDFLTLEDEYREQALEHGLVSHIKKLLLELGKGFAFLGSQYPVEVAGDDYYLDLLFYHTTLHCYCIIELKNTDFKPEYTGKMSFYISAVDDQLKKENDNPTIGIILCKTKNTLKVEYALRGTHKPIGVSEYSVKIMQTLPKNLKSSLPTIEDIEAELLPKKRKASKKKA